MKAEPFLCNRGCGVMIVWRGKNFEKRGSTGLFETATNIEHTYRRCDNIIKNKKVPDPNQTKLFGYDYLPK